jgi:hypothetical protein
MKKTPKILLDGFSAIILILLKKFAYFLLETEKAPILLCSHTLGDVVMGNEVLVVGNQLTLARRDVSK